MIVRSALVLLMLIISPVSSLAERKEDYGDMAARGYALWTCAALGGLAAKETEEVLPFFDKGYDLLSRVVQGMINDELTEEEYSKVPVGITWSLGGGPSVDFRLGAVWTDIRHYQYDKTYPDLENTAFDDQKKLQAQVARNTFDSSNCSFLVAQ